MNRSRKSSPFPTAYRVIADAENDRTLTIPAPPSDTLLEACKHRGATCSVCGEFDEIAFDWGHGVVMNDDGDVVDEWYCKLCYKRELAPSPYRFQSYKLDNAVDEPFNKKKT